ncbi:MAG: tRNA lysidine(34) synthetase TilS [Pseudomonadota bacterium]
MSVLADISDPALSINTQLIDQVGDFTSEHNIAVAVSGGPDSMALAKLLSLWSVVREGPKIHALIVDHNIRKDSGAEAKRVAKRLKALDKTTAHILECNLAGRQTKIQEVAREERYRVIAEYCAAHDIANLFLGHHQDDQAETVLFRLSKGSGLDGLAGMLPQQEFSDELTLIRPFLRASKQDLLDFCEDMKIETERDPSNENDKFARVRLRQSMEILSEEGLSAKRLSSVAHRLARARSALEELAEETF